MSERDPVAVVRALWDAWERRDNVTTFELYDPDVVWDMTRSNVPGLGLYHGQAGVRQFFEEWLGTFEEFYARPEAFEEAGGNVVVQVRQGGRGKGSGVNVEMPVYWHVFFVRGEKVVRVEVHHEHEVALGSARAGVRAAG